MSWFAICGGGRKEEPGNDKVRDGSNVQEYKIELESVNYWEYVKTAGFSIDTLKSGVQRPGGFPVAHRKRLWERVVDEAKGELHDEHPQTWNDNVYAEASQFVEGTVLDIFRTYSDTMDGDGNGAATSYLDREQSKEGLSAPVYKAIHQIKLDLDRSQQIYNDRLIKLLLTFVVGNKNPKYGQEIFVQGMDAIAHMLIGVLDDEHAYWAFTIICEVSLEDYFTHGLEGARIEIEVFTKLLKEKIPKIPKTLLEFPHVRGEEEVTMYINAFTFQWFQKLFAGCLPRDTALHVFDIYFTLMCSREGARELQHAVGLSIFMMIEPQFYRAKGLDEAKVLIQEFVGESNTDNYGKLARPEVSHQFMKIVYEFLEELQEEDILAVRAQAEKKMRAQERKMEMRRSRMKRG